MVEIFFPLNAVENCEKICAFPPFPPPSRLSLSVDPLTSEIRVDLAATTATGLHGGASSLVTMRKNCMKYLMRTISMVPIKLSSYAVKLLGAEPA